MEELLDESSVDEQRAGNLILNCIKTLLRLTSWNLLYLDAKNKTSRGPNLDYKHYRYFDQQGFDAFCALLKHRGNGEF
jgi:hypothetical protein